MDPVRNNGVRFIKLIVLLETIIIKFCTGWIRTTFWVKKN